MCADTFDAATSCMSACGRCFVLHKLPERLNDDQASMSAAADEALFRALAQAGQK